MTFGPNLNGFFDVGAQLSEFLKKKAEACFAATDAEKMGIATVEQFERRRETLRAHFLEAIGGLPEERTPLQPTVTGELQRDGYVIRKIVFQSQPGFHVTANLYMPNGAQGKVPAVLVTSGHDELAKSAPLYQKVCIDLARNGIAAFAPDPFAQGERVQYIDKRIGRTLVRWHAQHTYVGMQCDWLGSSMIRYFLWDLIRAVDYLHTLPEIDHEHIGVAGNSVGGVQTTLLMMTESRIRAAAPCTYVTSREAYMQTQHSQCADQMIYGAIAAGLDYDDYITLFAPRTALIGAVRSDYFCVEGTLDTYEKARRVYALYGCEDELELGLVDGMHGFIDELRETVVNFFIRKFRPGQPAYKTNPEMKAENKHDLNCTASGQVLVEYADAREIHDLVAEYMEERGLPPRAGDPAAVRNAVRTWLRLPDRGAPLHPRFIRTTKLAHTDSWLDELQQHHIVFQTEKNIAVPGIYVEKIGRTADAATVFILEEGVNEIEREKDLILAQLLAKGDVFLFDPRGNGQASSRPVNGRPFYEMYGTEYKLGWDAQMMKTTLTALRVFDVLRACDFIRRFHPGKKLSLGGKGVGAVYALLAAALEDEVERVYLENMVPSFAELAKERLYKYDTRYQMYGILNFFDLPDVVRAVGEDKVELFRAPEVGRIIRS